MTPQPTYRPGWYADPEGRYDFRYHNGETWTNDVSRDGERLVDDGGDHGEGQQRHRDRRATVALVLAIIGLCLSWMPLFFVAGAVCALVGIGLGFAARRRVPRDTRGFAGLSMVIGAVALGVCGLGVWLTMWVYDLVDAYENPPPSAVADLSCVVSGREVTVSGALTNLGDRPSRFRVVIEIAPDDEPRRYTVAINLPTVDPGDQVPLAATRSVRSDAVGTVPCTLSGVTGPPPLGIIV